MSVLSELDRTAVASAIERARAPRTQLTRTQALAPHKPRAKREKREPLNLEKGKHRPRPEMLTRIAEATGKPLDYFLVEDEDPNPFPDDEAA